jgi:hydrogenase-4 component F
MPWTGRLFAIGMLTLVGLPPFGIFVSEFLLIKAAFATDHYMVAGVVLALLLTAFISLVHHLNRMLYGAAPEGVAVGERSSWPIVALAGCGLVLLVLGVLLPPQVTELLNFSTRALTP